jgi:hypothetical protein
MDMNIKESIIHKLQKINVNQIVIWGHKLHSHTHSYIHNAWFKTFNYLNLNTIWLDINSDISGINFDNSLFLTEGQVDENIPINYNNSYYILHNCNTRKYQTLIKNKKVIILQVFINSVRDELKFSNFNTLKNHYYLPNNIFLILPWATDLIPEEINKNLIHFSKDNFENKANFIGSIWEDPSNKDFSNKSQINTFKESCDKYKIEFNHYGSISIEKNIELIKKTKYSPSIQGKWQCDKGYIPCRIFKNISYGGVPITNNPEVYELFDKKIIFNENIDNLIDDTNKFFDDNNDNDFKNLMINVRDNHTYLNRINCYLDFINYVNDNNITNPDIKYLNNIWGGYL